MEGLALSVASLEIVEAEPRIKDAPLGERLGMAQPLSIRQLIDINRAELERYGLLHTSHDSRTGKDLQAGSSYYLNEPQALLLCILSRAERAADVRQEVVEVYMAYRRGDLPEQVEETVPIVSPVFPGFRFMEERKRLGFPSRRDFANGTGLPLAQVTQFEDRGLQTKRHDFVQRLLDAGFDVRYWETGERSRFRPINPRESAVLQAWRKLPETEQGAALAQMQRSVKAEEGSE